MAAIAARPRASDTSRKMSILSGIPASLKVVLPLAVGGALAGAVALAATSGGGTVSAPHRSVAHWRTREDVSVTNYLVASQVQADFVARAEEEAAAIRRDGGVGQQPQNEVVVWIVNDEASLALAMQGFFDTNAVRLELGLPETTLVDLRAVVR